MGFIDLFKDFHREAIRQEFPTSARVLYDILLYEFNGRYWTEEIGFSERDLSVLTGLSAATVHRAVKFLSDRNFIKTRRAKHGTAFKLLGENVPEEMKQPRSSNEAVVKQERSSNEAVETNSNIRVREDVKTLDIQSSVRSTRACAPVNWNAETEQMLTALWLDNNGARVTFELLSYFQALVEKHGVDWTAAIIREAANAYGGEYLMSPKYLRGCVERKLKGGDNRVRVGDQPRTARRNVLAFAGGRTAGDYGDIQTGKGRFDDDTPDYNWLRESDGDTSGTEN